VFVYDFVVATKVCHKEIFELHIDRNTRFTSDAFVGYNVILASTHDSIIMCWMPNLNYSVEHLAFDVN
jgi:hypothetical protein